MKRKLSQLERRLKELRPVPVSPEAGRPLWQDELSLHDNLARIKAASIEVFGEDVQCRYIPRKKGD